MTHEELLAKINQQIEIWNKHTPPFMSAFLEEGGTIVWSKPTSYLKSLRAVVALHKPLKSNRMFDVCEVCITPIDNGAFMHREYPCPTIKAIEEHLK